MRPTIKQSIQNAWSFCCSLQALVLVCYTPYHLIMYPISAPLIISSLLALSVDAAPQAPPLPSSASQPPSSASPVAVHNPPDACGPVNQLSFDPQDSCSSKPPTVTSAASFGVLGSIDSLREHGIDWATCNPVLDLICTRMFAPNATTGTVSNAFRVMI